MKGRVGRKKTQEEIENAHKKNYKQNIRNKKKRESAVKMASFPPHSRLVRNEAVCVEGRKTELNPRSLQKTHRQTCRRYTVTVYNAVVVVLNTAHVEFKPNVVFGQVEKNSFTFFLTVFTR